MKPYEDALATMDFSVRWEHEGIRHTDCRHAPRVNFWRDILPPGLQETMVRQPGVRSAPMAFDAGRVLPPRSPAMVHPVRREDVEKRRVAGVEIEPRRGRFYPRGILHGVPGVFRDNVQPFRCTDLDPVRLAADFNHPLSGKAISLDIAIHDLRLKFEEHGGTSIDWLEEALAGPGMQARADGGPTDFFSDRPFGRRDENEDAVFYERARRVNHIDDTAIGLVSRLYGRLIRPGSDVLDLMGSWTSHLPPGLELKGLTVLGMNAEELQANPRAAERCVHDLNLRPALPFADGRFDAVVCTGGVPASPDNRSSASSSMSLTPTSTSTQLFSPKVSNR